MIITFDYLHSPRTDDYGWREYGLRSRWTVRLVNSGKCIHLDVLRSRPEGYGEGPSGLTCVESFGILEIFKISMIGYDSEWMLDSLQPMPPFLQG